MAHSTKVVVITAAGARTYASVSRCLALESAYKGRWVTNGTFQMFPPDITRDGTSGEWRGAHSGPERMVRVRDAQGELTGQEFPVKDITLGAPQDRCMQMTRGRAIERGAVA